jgi:hypothetical protein
VLDVSLNRLRDEHAEILVDIPQPCRLVALDFIYNRFSPTGMRLLRQRFGDCVCLFDRPS